MEADRTVRWLIRHLERIEAKHGNLCLEHPGGVSFDPKAQTRVARSKDGEPVAVTVYPLEVRQW